MALLALLLLGVVPFWVWRYARAHVRLHTWLLTGAAFGLVISPLSLGLYSTYFFGPFGLPTGIIGLVSVLFHGAPGYKLALWLGLMPSYQVVSGMGHVYTDMLNGVIWAVAYGLVGLIVDWILILCSRRAA